MSVLSRRLAALSMAIVCHSAFTVAVGSMAYALATGLQHGHGTLHGVPAALANSLLLLQFPVLHSALLGARGRRVLQRLSPVGHGRTLLVTSFALVASLQLLLTFWGWSPSGVVWHEPHGSVGVVQWVAFGAAWLFLGKALWDAGLPVQSGAAGWWALWRGREVVYGDLPTHGLFARCRQPIYLGFALVLWTAPVWALDSLLLALGWGAYCVVGPLRKEARWLRLFGNRFVTYRTQVPYMLPRFRR